MEKKKHTQISANLAGAAAPASPNVATPLTITTRAVWTLISSSSELPGNHVAASCRHSVEETSPERSTGRCCTSRRPLRLEPELHRRRPQNTLGEIPISYAFRFTASRRIPCTVGRCGIFRWTSGRSEQHMHGATVIQHCCPVPREGDDPLALRSKIHGPY
jgi:hypothetical protein